MKLHLTIFGLVAGLASTAPAFDLSPWGDSSKPERDGLTNGRLSLAGSPPAKVILTLSAGYGSDQAGKAGLLSPVEFRVSWKAGDNSDKLVSLERVDQIHREIKDGEYRGHGEEDPGDHVKQGDQGEGHGGGDSGEGDDHRHHKPKKPSE